MKKITCFLFFVFALIVVFNFQEYNLYASEYHRGNWPHWKDFDKDCQSTRDEILIRDSLSVVVFKTDKGCKVVAGRWKCPYTDKIITQASKIDIDHVVPLENAYISGARFWTKKQKKIFANDPDNLLCVDFSANRSKGSRGPDEWRPDNKAYWRDYAVKWMNIKEKYNLSMSVEETRVLIYMMICK